MKQKICICLAALAGLTSLPSASAGPQEALDFFKTIETWNCFSSPQYAGGFKSESRVFMAIQPSDRITWYEKEGAMLNGRAYFITLQHWGDLSATQVGFSIRNTTSETVEADPLPNGSTWGDPSSMSIYLDLVPQNTSNTSYKFTGHSITNYGRINLECYPHAYR